jgi:hypothetical protein
VYWSDGLALAANPFPFLRSIGITTFWDVHHPVTERYKMENDPIRVDHFVDQSRPRYNINTEASLLAAKTDMLITNMFAWFFGFQKGPSELLFQRVGLRIIILTIITTFVLNHTHPQSTNPSWKNFSKNSVSDTSTVKVTAQLIAENVQVPLYPENSDFAQRDGSSFYVDTNSSYIYYRPSANYSDGVARVTIQRPACLLVYPGQKVSITTNRPPVFVVNMENKVIYVKKKNYLDNIDKLLHFFSRKEDVYITSSSWSYLNKNWHTVDVQNYAIMGSAKGNALVCF